MLASGAKVSGGRGFVHGEPRCLPLLDVEEVPLAPKKVPVTDFSDSLSVHDRGFGRCVMVSSLTGASS